MPSAWWDLTKQTSQHDVIKIYIQFLIWVLLLLFTLFTKMIICKQTFALSLLRLLHFFNTRNIKTKNETSHIHLNEKSGLMIHNAVTIYSFFFFLFFDIHSKKCLHVFLFFLSHCSNCCSTTFFQVIRVAPLYCCNISVSLMLLWSNAVTQDIQI